MRFRITRWALVVLVAVLGALFWTRRSAVAQGNTPDPRYYVSTITLTGPSTPGTYTIGITVARNGTALNVGVDGTVELRAGGTILASKTFTVLRNQNTTTLTIPLNCSGGNVAGAAASSGQSSISLVAHANETDSQPLTVGCGPGGATGGC
jgi:hypothetical protein